ncbi:DUF6527 family protein [Paraburkholderia bannensis]|uniref:DUF6527 family protein n=1 Tax=Paraburkholderia bannensis TaxID=765414 RepID=UPI002ABD5784|nr:DUF6527 family protein [Paraburkholderia bannensis]
MKLEELKDREGLRTMMFDCPGCGFLHRVHVAGSGAPIWSWNGCMERPTFTPSVSVTGVEQMTPEEYEAYERGEGLPEPRPLVCHSFVTDGRIRFLDDCTHKLAGQTVDLPDID